MKTFYDNDTITPLVQTHITESQAKNEAGKEIKNGYILYILIWIIGLAVVVRGFYMANYFVILMGAIFFIVGSLALIQTLIKRRVAMMMKTVARNPGEKIQEDETAAELLPQFKKAINIPPFQLDVYEQNELPDHSYQLNKT